MSCDSGYLDAIDVIWLCLPGCHRCHMTLVMWMPLRIRWLWYQSLEYLFLFISLHQNQVPRVSFPSLSTVPHSTALVILCPRQYTKTSVILVKKHNTKLFYRLDIFIPSLTLLSYGIYVVQMLAQNHLIYFPVVCEEIVTFQAGYLLIVFPSHFLIYYFISKSKPCSLKHSSCLSLTSAGNCAVFLWCTIPIFSFIQFDEHLCVTF